MLLTPLETILNRNIAASRRARTLCEQLAGKVLAIHVLGMPVSLYFKVEPEMVSLSLTHEGEPDATLSGSPVGLANLTGAKPESAFRSGSVRIEGDAETAQAFQELLQQAQPDFEEEMSRVIGDVAAHQVGNLARGALAFGRRAAETFAQNVGEYLQEESRDVPARTEVSEFVEAVDRLRDDVERAEARLRNLETRLRK